MLQEQRKITNRFFAAAAVLAALAGACACPVFAEEEKVSREIFAMDTVMTLTAYGEHAGEGIDAAVDEIARLDALLSTEKKDSEVARINEGVIGDESLSRDTAKLLAESLYLYGETDGAFDITVYPLMQLWGFTDGNYRVPTEEELAETMQVVGADGISYDEGTGKAAFGKEGMEIDFGGIAKGYTSGRIMEIFKENGVESGLVSLGGNVQTLGRKPDGRNFKIGIQNPDEDSSFLAVIEAADEAVITSGGYERYFEEDGVKYHHILDPKTGCPARSGLLSVSIVSPDGLLADGLSTALFVMGEEDAVSFWKGHSDSFEMILYTEDGRLLATGGLKDRLTSDYEIEWI